MEENLNYQFNDFEQNLKNKLAIVCPDVCGSSDFLTAEFFKNGQEFWLWKAGSDEDYRAREKAECREQSHTVSLDEALTKTIVVDSAEVLFFSRCDAVSEQARLREMLVALRTVLTSVQFRRLWNPSMSRIG